MMYSQDDWMQSEIMNLRAENQRVNQKCLQQHTEITALYMQLAQGQDRIEILERDFNLITQQKAYLERKIEQEPESLQRVYDSVRRYRFEVEVANKKIKDLQRKMDISNCKQNDNINDWKDKVDYLVGQLSSCESKLKNAEEEKEKLRKENQEYFVEMQALREEMETKKKNSLDAENSFEAQLMSELKAAKNQLDCAQFEMQTFQTMHSKLRALEAENAQLKKAQEFLRSRRALLEHRKERIGPSNPLLEPAIVSRGSVNVSRGSPIVSRGSPNFSRGSVKPLLGLPNVSFGSVKPLLGPGKPLLRPANVSFGSAKPLLGPARVSLGRGGIRKKGWLNRKLARFRHKVPGFGDREFTRTATPVDVYYSH